MNKIDQTKENSKPADNDKKRTKVTITKPSHNELTALDEVIDQYFDYNLATNGDTADEDEWISYDLANRLMWRLWKELKYSKEEEAEPWPEESDSRKRLLGDGADQGED